MAFFIPENESKGGDTRMMHLFVGMLLGILIGLQIYGQTPFNDRRFAFLKVEEKIRRTVITKPPHQPE